MKDLVRVELKDGTVCRMAKKAFNIFLSLNEVVGFERSDGWVRIDQDPVRDMASSRTYKGPERRRVI